MPQPHEKGLSDLEKLLAALPPRPTTLDRDNLLFRAGQASMRRSWVWPLAAVGMSVATGCLAMILVLHPLPEPVIQIVRVQVPVPTPDVTHGEPRERGPQAAPGYLPEGPPPALSYWRMQRQALRFGVEALPQAAAGDGDDTRPETAGHGPDYLAGSRPRVTDHSSLFLPFGER
jgi:hypothetical protein